ncbi:hypothetical protein EX30DRAFT_364310 [Ascodesmis nigricans]|uniref:Uncharacterized protein n=1 Tax=Ascodesmis nigricans TaxID=341454 RepID=A0A4S2MVU5_9PEZI|nr:hypothetical protein EX30DRAFT_364310 [Ascodesmis nigricans]
MPSSPLRDPRERHYDDRKRPRHTPNSISSTNNSSRYRETKPSSSRTHDIDSYIPSYSRRPPPRTRTDRSRSPRITSYRDQSYRPSESSYPLRRHRSRSPFRSPSAERRHRKNTQPDSYTRSLSRARTPERSLNPKLRDSYRPADSRRASIGEYIREDYRRARTPSRSTSSREVEIRPESVISSGRASSSRSPDFRREVRCEKPERRLSPDAPSVSYTPEEPNRQLQPPPSLPLTPRSASAIGFSKDGEVGNHQESRDVPEPVVQKEEEGISNRKPDILPADERMEYHERQQFPVAQQHPNTPSPSTIACSESGLSHSPSSNTPFLSPNPSFSDQYATQNSHFSSHTSLTPNSPPPRFMEVETPQIQYFEPQMMEPIHYSAVEYLPPAQVDQLMFDHKQQQQMMYQEDAEKDAEMQKMNVAALILISMRNQEETQVRSFPPRIQIGMDRNTYYSSILGGHGWWAARTPESVHPADGYWESMNPVTPGHEYGPAAYNNTHGHYPASRMFQAGPDDCGRPTMLADGSFMMSY